MQYRTRWCVDPHPQGKGKECSEQEELGPAIKSRSCNEHDCSEGTIYSPINTSPLDIAGHQVFHERNQIYIRYTNITSFHSASES